METPRLKFKNKEFGLREISNNLFELKSDDVFLKYLDTDFVQTKENYLYKENLVSKSKNTSIEGRKLQGKVISTFVNGKELFKIK